MATNEIQTNFELCLVCQTTSTEQLRQEPKDSSYDTFLNAVHERAEFGELEFVSMNDRLMNFTSIQLKENKAVWHTKCYSHATNKNHINRAKTRHERAISIQEAAQLKKRKGRPPATNPIPSNTGESSSATIRVTRSQLPKYIKNLCFFCQGDKNIPLHRCMSLNIGSQISDIVSKCNREDWKVNYADVITEADVLSRDLMYHKACITEQWQKLCQNKEETTHRSNKCINVQQTINFIAGEIQFYSQLQESIDSSEYIGIDQANKDYINIMMEHDLKGTVITRASLKQKIEENIENVNFTRPPT